MFIQLTRVYQDGDSEPRKQKVLANISTIASLRPKNSPNEAVRVTRSAVTFTNGVEYALADKYSTLSSLLVRTTVRL